ncbi:MAG: Na(+)/glucose symporter [Verrucomicrobiota bacterium]|jgi:SSS family solute:Na+ symporter
MNDAFRVYPIDIIIFVLFVVAVIATGLIKSRGEKPGSSEDYFLAGRGLRWWLIGFSLIAANISTEQFVGMSGNAASHVGMAIASYEWMAAITLVIVGFGFLPYFLRAGIYTMPEFLEYRFSASARSFMAIATIFIYLLLLGAVTYSGALTITTLAGSAGQSVSMESASLVIGVVAMLYVTAGGLKACAWADLIQGSALVAGGAVIMYFAFHRLGLATEAARVISTHTGAVETVPLAAGSSAVERFLDLNGPRLNMFLPPSDTVLPWTALLLGLWIPNFYYWGLNQYITQRTLGAASLVQGQKGIVFAAALKLVIPFVIVVPGLIAFNLFSTEMRLEAVGDTTVSLVRYLKSNPASEVVRVARSPAEADLLTLPAGSYLIAIYPDAAALGASKTGNPHVLPLTQARFDAIVPENYLVFASDDHSWRHVNAALAAEMDVHNRQVEVAARAAGRTPLVEKLIAYKYDTALAQLLARILPQGQGWVGFVLAALLGAVVSSLAAMLNAASTIFAMDIYQKLLSPQATQKRVVLVGRGSVVLFTGVAVFLAPLLGDPKISNSIFTVIQEGQGFISPGILAVFVFGLLVRKAPPVCGIVGLCTNLVAYGTLKFAAPGIQFLNRMALCFALCLAVMTILRLVKPLAQPFEFRRQTAIALESSRSAQIAGGAVVAVALLFYLIFSPWGVAT